MPLIRIALAQSAVVSAEEGAPKLEKRHTTSPFPTLEQNLIDAGHKIAKAKAEGADVVILPEYFLQGIVNEGRQYLTFPADHLLSFIQALAKRHTISVVGSIVHGRLPASAEAQHAPFPTASPFEHLLIGELPHGPVSPGGRAITEAQRAWAEWLAAHPPTVEESVLPVLSNTAFFVDDGGKVVGQYVKQNLWHPERLYLSPGRETNKAFNTKFGRVGLLICWDISHPGASQNLANQGVEIVFAPTYWLATDSEPHLSRHAHAADYEHSVVQALSYARSFETEAVWVLCNAGGDPLEGFMGGSAVWAPLRGRIDGFDGAQVGLKIVEVDTDVLKDARDAYKIHEDHARREAS